MTSSDELNTSMNDLAAALKKAVTVSDRKYRLTTYKNAFVGSEAVDFMMASGMAESREDAVTLGQALSSEFFLFEHVTRDHPFMDDYKFYHFIDGDRGSRTIDEETGKKIGWGDFLPPTGMKKKDGASMNPSMPAGDIDADFTNIDKRDLHIAHQVWPLDEHNQTLLNHVHPPGWKDPVSKNDDHYDLVVVGGGTAGLVTAAGSAGVGARVAMIEAHMLGGDCLNVGCVPSKTIIHSANLAHTLRGDMERLNAAGVSIEGGAAAVKVDFDKVMERVRKIRADISHHDSVERYSKELGVDIFIGYGKFTSEKTVVVNGRTLTFKRAAVCTGGYPSLIPMPGLKELHEQGTAWGKTDTPRPAVMTNETVFNLTSQPTNMVVIGAGVIGLELAQSMQRLGTPVTVLGRSGKILPKEDEDMAILVKEQMIKDGVEFKLSVAEYQKIEMTGKVLANGLPELKMTILEKGKSAPTVLMCDSLLIAAGRRPNVTGMDLEAAGVKYDLKEGLIVNDKLQTSNPKIYGVGDVASKYKFTHAADFMARTVIKNALFFGSEKMSNLLIPYATFTSPEIASVGLYGGDLDEKGIEYRVFEKHFKDNDRSMADDEMVGFVRFRVDAKTDKILGASIVGPDAGNMISEVTLAMQSETGLGALAAVIHPYPTTAEAIRQAGDLYNKTRLTNTVKQLLRGVIKLQR